MQNLKKNLQKLDSMSPQKPKSSFGMIPETGFDFRRTT